ncbi:dihydrofolate reductase [Winogradskyella sp. PC-19]|uniref:dihydrofolate reductase n=1 Tax=unclassified Winogradskyella TaxID=2615021 RepID=UPI000B3CCBB0|nr:MULTISPECIES: dihydrofolate reductase [unclassified Winogradskyella]ARV09382.1 dihydrofolate reductase [Winogradskyella sp. PC-19]
MFGKKKQTSSIDKDQLELIENAQKRIKQKKRLYIHFVIFLIGAVFLIIANTFLGIGEDFTIAGINWFVYAILAWLFLFIYHFVNVFITNKFMGKDWEKQQLDKLVAKQQQRINKLEERLSTKDTGVTKAKVIKEIKTPIVTSKKNKNSELTIIVAAGENNAIGKDNDLIWHLSDDLKRFKQLTNGHHIIMGRKTFESFPKPLPNRIHIVITRQEKYQATDGVIIVNSLADALDAARSDKNPFVIGGGEIYKQAMPLADKLEITRVHATFDDADTFFPEIDSNLWEEKSRITHDADEKHAHAFSFITYVKR